MLRSPARARPPRLQAGQPPCGESAALTPNARSRERGQGNARVSGLQRPGAGTGTELLAPSGFCFEPGQRPALGAGLLGGLGKEGSLACGGAVGGSGLRSGVGEAAQRGLGSRRELSQGQGSARSQARRFSPARGTAAGGVPGGFLRWGPAPSLCAHPSRSHPSLWSQSFIYPEGRRIRISPTNANPNTNKFLSKCSHWRKLRAVSQADIRGAARAPTGSAGSCFIHQA